MELPSLALNSEILNTAYIYFDFNPPIITNTTLNINGYVGLSDQMNNTMDIFPNPSAGSFQINGVEDGQLFITATSGNLIVDKKYIKGDLVDLSCFDDELYFVRIKNDSGEYTQKLNVLKK
jgi:hypothetical protein